MADTWMEDSEVSDPFEGESSWDYLNGGTESYDLEDDDFQESAYARRRARQRQLELARQRQRVARARARGQLVSTARPAPRTAAAAVRQLDLDTRLQTDTIRRALLDQDRRASRAEIASVASVVGGQVQNSFGDVFRNVWARAALSFAPLLILSPRRRGTGFGAVARDPRFVGGLVVAGVVLAGERRDRAAVVQKLNVVSVPTLVSGTSLPFFADPIDKSGAVIADRSVTWTTSNRNVADVDPLTGVVSAGEQTGPVIITATVDGVVARVPLVVTPS